MNVSRHIGKLRSLQLNAFIKLPLEGVGSFPNKVLQEANERVKRDGKISLNRNLLVLLNSGNFHIVEKPKTRIIDPLAPLKIEINIPISKIINNVDLPSNQEREMIDPTKGIVEKKAHKIIRARRRKMKKHRRKKWLKKFRAVLLKRKVNEQQKRLEEAKAYLNAMDVETSKFDVENYVENKLEIYNWTRPRTHLYGQLCPEHIVKEWYEKKAEKKRLSDRINYSLTVQDMKKT